MSYSIIAPQALVGIPLPTSDEINNPMDFMKYVVKRHNMIEGINRTNFFLNTQSPGVIFQTPNGSRFIGAAKLEAKNRKHASMYVRPLPPYVSTFDHPYVRSLPPPYGTILMGVNNNTFGPTGVVGPGGLVIPTKPVTPMGVAVSAAVPFGVRNYVPVHPLTPLFGGITSAPFSGAMPVPVMTPLGPGVVGMGLGTRETIDSLTKALEEAKKELRAEKDKGTGASAILLDSLTKRVRDLEARLKTKTEELAKARGDAAAALGETSAATPEGGVRSEGLLGLGLPG